MSDDAMQYQLDVASQNLAYALAVSAYYDHVWRWETDQAAKAELAIVAQQQLRGSYQIWAPAEGLTENSR